LDIDHFKQVNDTHGHPVGDEVLEIIAERCQQNIRNVDVLGRVGGEEFVILLPETMFIGSVNLTASFGIACYSPDVEDLYALLRNADIALYSAKRNGRNRFHAFTAEMSKIA